MPRYFFHITDGKKVVTEHKPEGVELEGDATATEEGMMLARGLRDGRLMRGRDWDGWFVKIVDEQGREVDMLPIADAV